MKRYRVRDGVRVVVDGTAYSDGETFSATPEQAAPLLQYGWVTPVEDARAARATRSRKAAT